MEGNYLLKISKTIAAIIISLTIIGTTGIIMNPLQNNDVKENNPEFIPGGSTPALLATGPLMWVSFTPYGETDDYGIPNHCTVLKEVYITGSNGQSTPFLIGNISLRPYHWGYRNGIYGMILSPLKEKIGYMEIYLRYETSTWGGFHNFDLKNSSTTMSTTQVTGFDYITKNLLFINNLSEEAYFVKENNRTTPEIGYGDGNITFAINLRTNLLPHTQDMIDGPPTIGEHLSIWIYGFENRGDTNMISNFQWSFISGGFTNGTLNH